MYSLTFLKCTVYVRFSHRITARVYIGEIYNKEFQLHVDLLWGFLCKRVPLLRIVNGLILHSCTAVQIAIMLFIATVLHLKDIPAKIIKGSSK